MRHATCGTGQGSSWPGQGFTKPNHAELFDAAAGARLAERPATMETSKHKAVFTIVPREGRAYWVRIGKAVALADGTIHMKLDAPPSFGAMQLRDWEPEGAGGAEAADGSTPL